MVARRPAIVTTKRMAIAFIAIAVLAGTAYFVDLGERKSRADHELEVARAVRVLPSGTEQAWLQYVDRRIAATLVRRENAIQVVAFGDNVRGNTTIVSINTPYQVQCDPISGGSVDFGYGDNPVTVPIFGLMVMDPSAEKAPPLGVNMTSIAATKLTEALCRRISDRVQAIIGQK